MDMKIKGITGVPYCFSRWQGYFDGKRGIVKFQEGSWKGAYIDNKISRGIKAILDIYYELEQNTASLHEESRRLCMEYNDIKAALKLVEETQETEETQESNVQEIKNRLKARKQRQIEFLKKRPIDIRNRLAVIDELLIEEVTEAENKKKITKILTEIRIRAYIQGASIAIKNVEGTYQLDMGLNEKNSLQEDHIDCEKQRKEILTQSRI